MITKKENVVICDTWDRGTIEDKLDYKSLFQSLALVPFSKIKRLYFWVPYTCT